ncbi:hypothetical protein ACKTEK_02565 [Tepidamorphus sp. 3E244]|uniref:hypothetical protein n=1 Tax=Tepidamorphus sp. 3E244 TaxID=3385498 RepID=UPI0038FC8A56
MAPRKKSRLSKDMQSVATLAPLVFSARVMEAATGNDARGAAFDLARYGAEKMTSFWLSGAAMQLETMNQWQRMWFDAASGKTSDPVRSAQDIAAAGIAPIRKQVRKNNTAINRRKKKR